MESIRGKVIKGSKDRNGKTRKFIAVPALYYDDFDFGDVVRIEKVNGT